MLLHEFDCSRTLSSLAKRRNGSDKGGGSEGCKTSFHSGTASAITRSRLAAVHDTAKGLHKAGVMDQVALRELDQLCLPPVEPLAPEQVKRIRVGRRPDIAGN